jgi:hypothetical protein
LGFEVSRQEFVRSESGSPIGFDIVARRPGEITFIDVMASDRVTVSDIITTLTASPVVKDATTSGTFIVTEGAVDPVAAAKASAFGVRIVNPDELRKAFVSPRGRT